MPRRGKISDGGRLSPGASPVGAGRGHSAGATSVVTFAALSEPQWQAIRSTRAEWPEGTNWRGEMEQVGRDIWEAWAERQACLKKKLRGEKPAKQKERVDRALLLTRELQKALKGLPPRVVAVGHDTSIVMIETNGLRYIIGDPSDALTQARLLELRAPLPSHDVVPLGS
jgi:hypothetical protein